MAQFDAAAKALMSQHDVHKMSIAVSREGRLVFARGYLRNSQGHAPTGATTARFASCSKLLTSIAIHRLIELGKFAMTDRMADLIDIDPPPGMTAGNNTWGAVTIEDLLKMRSGLRPGFADLDKKVVDAFSGSLPVTEKRQIASYLRTFDTGTLVFRNKRWEWTTGDDPDIATMPSNPDSRGTDFYRNTDWFLLTVVIEEITGKDYVDAVDDFILRPLGGLKTVQVANSRASEVGETDYEPSDTKLYPSVFSDKQEPVKRGFGDVNLEVGVGVGGWRMSSTDFVRILSAFDFPHSNPILTADSIQSRMWAPGNSAGWGESQIDSVISHGWGGVLPGLNSIVSHRADNVSFAIWWNKDIADSGFVFPEGSAEPKDHWVHWHEIIGDVTNWPSHDFFPDFGLGPPDGPRKHSGIFTPQPAERRYVWGSSMADLRARNTELFAKGFRMIHQQSFATWEGRRYDAMWAPGTDGRPIVWGWAFNDLKKRNDERVAGGWRMIHQQSYVTKDGRRYDAIWMPGTGPRPIVWGWTQQDLKIRNDELFNQGFRLIHQQSYEIPSGGRRYDAIWAPGTGPRPIVWGWTLKDLGARNHVLFGQGLRMIHQQAYYLGSELRYDAIWAPASDGRPITWEKQMPTFQARIESLDSAGYRMLHQHSVPNDPKDAYQDR